MSLTGSCRVIWPFFHDRSPLRLQAWIKDSAIGVAVSAPVFWMFTQLLAINLPGLTNTGWL